MELLDDEAQVEAPFGPFGDSANIDERQVAGLRRTYHRLKKSFQMHPMLHLGDEAQVKARFGPSGDRVNLDTDRCTVCTKRTIGSEIVLDAPMVLLGDKAQVQARSGMFRDFTSLDARWVDGLR